MDSESEKLRKQIDSMKNDYKNEASNEDLARSINSLIKIFAEASEDLKIDTHDAVLVSQKLDKILSRLEKIEIQNEKIAKGIVALADMVEDTENQLQSPSRPPEPVPRASSEIKPLPSYNMPPEQKKKSPFNFKI